VFADVPEAPVVEPEAPVVEPEALVVEPEAPVVEPDAPVVEPEAPVIEPEAPVVEPVFVVVDDGLMPLRGPPGVVVDAPWAGDPDVGRVVSAIQSSANPKRAKQAESLASETVAAGLGSTPGGPSSLGLRQAGVPATPSPPRRSGSPFFVAVGRRQNRRVPRKRRRSPKAVAAAFPLS
jgi:hypothetical protein